jgi:excisionase family DNA binding protein
MDERYYTIEDVAERLKVHPNTIRRWIREGELIAVNLPGRTIRIRGSELERLTGGNTEGGPKPAPDA